MHLSLLPLIFTTATDSSQPESKAIGTGFFLDYNIPTMGSTMARCFLGASVSVTPPHLTTADMSLQVMSPCSEFWA
jgi:hypothetical protein